MGTTRNLRSSEGGSGGRLGRSNMDHVDYIGDRKAAARTLRRQQNRVEVLEGLDEADASADALPQGAPTRLAARASR